MNFNDKPIPELEISDLERIYTEGYEPDKRIFAEMRTNLQLVAGEHYAREGSRFWNRIRDDRQLTSEQRLKLTKNHIQRITKEYRNQIESVCPDVAILPAKESDLHCQKTAELNQAYWDYCKDAESIDEKKSLWIKNYVEMGEVCVKVFWDPNGGKVVGYAPQMTETAPGEFEMAVDEMGNLIADENEPQWGGRLKIETVDPYTLRRDPSARTMDESPYLCIGKLIPNRAIQTMLQGDKEKMEKLNESPTNEWTVYDNNTMMYRSGHNQTLVKEIYWRPAPSIPNGYYYIWTSKFKIAQGELPLGIFPIIHTGFDQQTGNARSHSVIRHVRPGQLEINRCASKMAEHQITLGDDKVLMPQNGKLSQGALLPGIRVSMFSGQQPQILEGRSGAQYMDYMQAQIAEIYQLANVPEILEDNVSPSPDPYTNLMQSFRFRKKFVIYGQKFERFYCKIVDTGLKIAKDAISEGELIKAVGSNEYINIAEFKNSDALCYRIKVQPRSDDIESTFGKQLVINHALQYVGTQLDKSDIGQLLRNSPFLNDEKMFQKLTQPYDRLVNDILALDRGIPRPVRPFDDNDYYIQGLTLRMSQPDFEFLPAEVQSLYEAKLSDHENAKAMQLAQIQRAQGGFIPSGGYMVVCDLYTPTPTANNPSAVSRVKVPSEALNWLVQKLQDQGNALHSLLESPQGAMAQVGNLIPGQAMKLAMPAPAPGGPPMPSPAMPSPGPLQG